jgi:hypothetical protein
MNDLYRSEGDSVIASSIRKQLNEGRDHQSIMEELLD